MKIFKKSTTAVTTLIGFFVLIFAIPVYPVSAQDSGSAFTLVSGSETDLCTAPTYEGEVDLIGRFIHSHVLLPYRNIYEFRPVSSEIRKLPLTSFPIFYDGKQMNNLLTLKIAEEQARGLPTDRVIKIKVNNYKAFCEGNPQVEFISLDDAFPSQQWNFILVAGDPNDTCSHVSFLGEESLRGTFIHNTGELGMGQSEYEFVVDEGEISKLPLQNIQADHPWFNQKLAIENLQEIMPLVEQNLDTPMTITVDKYSAYCEGSPIVRFKKNFSDVGADHSFKDAIQFLKSKNIVSGNPDGTFTPDEPINRAEFTKIVLLSAFTEEDLLSPSSCFSDVAAEDWFSKYVCTARAGYVVKGYTDATFKPEQNIILAEALKILMKIKGISYEATDTWHEGIMAKAQELQLVPFEPAPFDLRLTRGQMAAVTAKFLQN